jgi:hypothetical protein
VNIYHMNEPWKRYDSVLGHMRHITIYSAFTKDWCGFKS